MLIILIAFVVYFLIVLSERALVAVSPHDLEALRADGSGGAQRAIVLVGQIRPALAALLLARLFLKVFLAVWIIHTFLQSTIIKHFLYQIGIETQLPGWCIWVLALSLVSLCLTLGFWLIKRSQGNEMTSDNNAKTLRYLSRFISFWRRLFTPLIHHQDRQTEVNQRPVMLGDEKNGALLDPKDREEKQEIELLKSIVRFSDVTVKQVMQARTKVVAIEQGDTFAELLGKVRSFEFSRLPVFSEDLDNVIGILYVKDLLPHLDEPADFDWSPLMRKQVILVPESKRGSELLQEFKQQKMHMAIVVDEYGGSAGIVTLEDILEEVTGDIRDEFDEETDLGYRKIDDYNYIFEGQTQLNDLFRITGLSPDTFDEVRGTADTLAGLALSLRGDIPATGTEINWNGYVLTITSSDGRRIGQLKLSLPRSV